MSDAAKQYKADRKAWLSLARDEGAEKAASEVARAALRRGVPRDQVMQICGIDDAAVDQLTFGVDEQPCEPVPPADDLPPEGVAEDVPAYIREAAALLMAENLTPMELAINRLLEAERAVEDAEIDLAKLQAYESTMKNAAKVALRLGITPDTVVEITGVSHSIVDRVAVDLAK